MSTQFSRFWRATPLAARCLLLALLVAALLPAVAPALRAQMTGPTAVFTNTAGQQITLNLEIADTPEKQTRGLMFRQEMPEDTGMIFIFPVDVQVGFWMQNTYLPLSIAFLSADGAIVDILDMQPQTTDVHVPMAAYRYAIEVNQGYFERHGIGIGDTAALKLTP